MIQASVEVRNIEGFDSQMEDIFLAVDADLNEIAQFVKDEADRTTDFIDKTGKLRTGNKKRKSRFENGGYIVLNAQPHAHLVEFGHVMLTAKGEATKLGRVPAHPFMRNALETGINKAVSLLS